MTSRLSKKYAAILLREDRPVQGPVLACPRKKDPSGSVFFYGKNGAAELLSLIITILIYKEVFMKRLLVMVLFVLLCGGTAFAAVNINTATVDELSTLTGIGKVKAEAIVAYREAYGPFKTVDDLKHVKGIGKKTVEKLQQEVTFGEAGEEATAEPSPMQKAVKKAEQKVEKVMELGN